MKRYYQEELGKVNTASHIHLKLMQPQGTVKISFSDSFVLMETHYKLFDFNFFFSQNVNMIKVSS